MPQWSRNKYNVAPKHRRFYKGRTYDSRAEMLFAEHLDRLVLSGEVVDYCDQPKVHLAGELWYRPDFFVVEPDEAYFVDVKGVITDGFRKVCLAWKARTGLPLRVIKMKGKNFVTTEIIFGKEHDER